MNLSSSRLLITAGILLALAGALFGFLKQFLLMALLWVGAFGCVVAARNFRQQKGR
ncbi:MAG: hypothetical protein Q4E18_04185 [Clostridia bacterium]|nr:hypothetical protein [Clostridia bacterium]